MFRGFSRLLPVLLLALAGTACEEHGVLVPEERHAADPEWPRATPAEAGLDPGILRAMSDRLRSGAYPGLHSLLVVRHGRLAFEEYFGGHAAAELHTMQSVSKSVTSLLVGIAMQQGAIRSLDQRVLEFFPEYGDVRNLGAWKRDLTLEDLLTMRTGYSWYESPYAGSPLERLNTDTSDWIRFMLEWPMRGAPGERFNYNTGGVVLLAGVLGRATGMRADTFAQRFLFEPLGIREHRWIHGYPDGLPHTGGGLFLRPRDMAKLGQLMLDGGRWKGRQIVSREWVRASTERIVRGAWSFGDHPVDYGYLWWIADRGDPMGDPGLTGDVYVAAGARGQWIFIVPEDDLVVVATGWEYGPEWVAPLNLLHTSILRAVRGR